MGELRLSDDFLCPDGATFVGFILNNPHKRMMLFNRRHWMALKRIGRVWFNLDSLEAKPKRYETRKEVQALQNWLIAACVNNDAQLLICRRLRKQQGSLDIDGDESAEAQRKAEQHLQHLKQQKERETEHKMASKRA